MSYSMTSNEIWCDSVKCIFVIEFYFPIEFSYKIEDMFSCENLPVD